MSTEAQLPPEQAARVLGALRQLRDSRFGGVNAALGRAIGRSGAAIGAMLGANPKNRPSLKTAERVAKLMGITPEALLYGGATVPPDSRTNVTADPYPLRDSALRRLSGMVPPEVELRLRAIVLTPEDPPMTEADWIDLALKRVRDHEREERLARLGRT